MSRRGKERPQTAVTLPSVLRDIRVLVVEDGFDLIRRLRDGSRRVIPMVALTAFATQVDESRILAAGYDAYLAKPIDGTELVAAVERLARAGP